MLQVCCMVYYRLMEVLWSWLTYLLSAFSQNFTSSLAGFQSTPNNWSLQHAHVYIYHYEHTIFVIIFGMVFLYRQSVTGNNDIGSTYSNIHARHLVYSHHGPVVVFAHQLYQIQSRGVVRHDYNFVVQCKCVNMYRKIEHSRIFMFYKYV